MYNMNQLFAEGLTENDPVKLLKVPKSDIHNHSTKGCSLTWLEHCLQYSLPKPPDRFNGLQGMQEWFTSAIKPHCAEIDQSQKRWEGAFAEAKRNNIRRLAVNFSVQDIDAAGGMDSFRAIVKNFHAKYCPDTLFEPEITYVSTCNIDLEAERIDRYIESGFFTSIDVCGYENIQPFEAFLPLYRKAEKYHLTKIMHVGESGSAEDIQRAVETLALDEVHHGIHAVSSEPVMRFLADHGIQLNVCPTSNVKLGYAAGYKDHPIKILYENGIKLTINTDDLLLFNSSIENEYLLLYRSGALGITALNEIREIGLNGRRT